MREEQIGRIAERESERAVQIAERIWMGDADERIVRHFGVPAVCAAGLRRMVYAGLLRAERARERLQSAGGSALALQVEEFDQIYALESAGRVCAYSAQMVLLGASDEEILGQLGCFGLTRGFVREHRRLLEELPQEE